MLELDTLQGRYEFTCGFVVRLSDRDVQFEHSLTSIQLRERDQPLGGRRNRELVARSRLRLHERVRGDRSGRTRSLKNTIDVVLDTRDAGNGDFVSRRVVRRNGRSRQGES